MKHFGIVYVFLAMSLLGGSCCKKDQIAETYYIPDEVLYYVHFDKGSWWKYVETSTGAIDSVPVTNSVLKTEIAASREMQKEWIDFVLKGETYRTGVHYFFDPDKPPTNFEIYEGDDQQSCITFFYCVNGCDTNPSIPYPEGLCTREEIDSIIIQGSVYTDVVHIVNSNSYPNGVVTEAWYARNIGVIKRRFLDGTDWELIDSYVTQTY